MDFASLKNRITSTRAGRVLSIVVIVLVALQIILAIALTPVVRGVLSSTLLPETKLKLLYVNLFGGTVSVRGLEIAQPEGYGEGAFLTLGKARINISLSSLLIGRITVTSVHVADLAVTIINDTNGVMNVTKLTPPSEDRTEEVVETKTDKPAKPSSLVARVGLINVDRLSFTFLDQSKNTDKPIEVNLRDAHLDVRDLLFAPAQADRRELVSTARFTGRIEHADTPPAFIGLSARLGPLGGEIPGAVANLILTGVELGAAGSIIPPGVAATVGGDMIDVNAKVRVAVDILDLDAAIETTGAVFPVKVGGTPAHPSIDAGALLFGVFGRFGNLLGNTVGDVASAGLAVGEGALNVATSVGKGAAGIVTGVGRGLFSTVKSAATLDVKGVGSGLADTVTGAGKGALDTVTEAGSAAASSVSDAGKATMGGHRADDWRSGKETRHEKNWTAAQAWVSEAMFPAPSAKTPADAVSPVEETPAQTPESPAADQPAAE